MYVPLYSAVKSFFERAVHNGESLLVVFANPDRAFDEARRVMARRLNIKQSQMEDRPALVPFISLFMSPPRFNPQLYNPGRTVVSKDVRSGTAQVMRWPRPVTVDVQVDLWCGSAGGDLIAQQIQGQIDLMFRADSVDLPVNWADPRWYKPPFNLLEHAKVLGATKVRLTVEGGWSDNSDLESGEGPKEVRRTWAGRLTDAYIPYRPEEARLVARVGFEVFDDSTVPPTLIEASVVGED